MTDTPTVEDQHFVIGGWGYSKDHPQKWHIVDGETTLCGMMSRSISHEARGSLDWVRDVDSKDWAERITYGELCANCKRAGGFDAVR